MKVWRIDYDVNNYRNLILKENVNNGEFLKQFTGVSKKTDWKSPEFEFIIDEDELPIGDITPFGGGILVVKDWVAEKMKESFGHAIELLPISVEGEINFSIVHILDVCDCVDYDASSIKYFPNSEKILRIKKYAFHEAEVKHKTIFKDAGFPKMHIFVSQMTKLEIEKWNLSGVKFIEFWDSSND